ncbi:14025_t:CDS:2 [Dentiscutata erythropus]|uniref:14025_t:CDS:1 n=1 Tax=Dentiscutata erythropus TaxID=1348616 RepID=A0A9N8WGU7_9GLOM|nr:14025_t:CDS:2 [Dentiscutata erythropus]
MFRNQYISYKHCQNYIRHLHKTFNTPFDSDQLRTEANYENINNHEIPNKDSFDEVDTNYENINNYTTPNEDSFDERVTNYENTNDDKTPNEDSFDKGETNCEKTNDLFDEVMNDVDEDFFNDEILDDDNEMPINYNNKEPSEKGPDKVVDEALNIEQMPSINGEFAPYFKNITEALMFFWIQKHNISTCTYEELVDIIRHPQFKNEDIVANIHQFRKYWQRLPLLSIKT